MLEFIHGSNTPRILQFETSRRDRTLRYQLSIVEEQLHIYPILWQYGTIQMAS